MTTPAVQLVPIIMTTTEAAAILRCEESTVERYVHRHELSAILIGKERRIRGRDLLEFIDRRPTTQRTGNNGKRI